MGVPACVCHTCEYKCCTCQGKFEEVIESLELELRWLGANFYLEIINMSWASGLLQGQQVLLTAELEFVFAAYKAILVTSTQDK